MKNVTDITILNIHERTMTAIENKYKDFLDDSLAMIQDAADRGEFYTKIHVSKENAKSYGFVSMYFRMKGFSTSFIDDVVEIRWDEPTIGNGKNLALERFQTKQSIQYL